MTEEILIQKLLTNHFSFEEGLELIDLYLQDTGKEFDFRAFYQRLVLRQGRRMRKFDDGLTPINVTRHAFFIAQRYFREKFGIYHLVITIDGQPTYDFFYREFDNLATLRGRQIHLI